ncbi:ATP-binding cassette domain-containing protein [Rhizobium sp. 16-449-1b]|uniref:ABC transporter permease subunit n=1 Tax=Rhizobium sp. 16-449-1b TaxID=2819989 RepID=UPI001ADBD2D3|nr:ATP-binding cassette domain-containing protein [Rhizobium sp. 16-449-1b]MBO9195987.1 ATP-binding cassette domain-containing protein [Rhizobium sp. 16-449-1b]
MRALSISVFAILALISVPTILGDYWAYQLSLYLLYACAATGVGICWGQAGFLPLGQAVFFGISAYASGLGLLTFTGWVPLSLTLIGAALLSAVIAFVIGLAVFRKRGENGPYFSMITLALSLLTFQLATSWDRLTGGYNGLKDIPALPGLDDYDMQYYLAVGALALALAIGGWLVTAPVGVLWRAIAQNERRVILFGFNANFLKAMAFGVGALLAGIGGALYAPQQGLVTPQQAGFQLSADLVIWAAVGGRGSLWGPVIGACVIGVMTAQLRDSISFWEILMALFFMVMVLLFPAGLIGLVTRLAGCLPRSASKPRLMAPEAKLARTVPDLKIEGIVAGFNGFKILKDLSLGIDRKGICCLIGPNGAGKTSAFNLLTGEMPVNSGKILFNGRDLVGMSSHRIARLGIGRKLQIPSVFSTLTVADNLCIALWASRASWLDLFRPSSRSWTAPLLEELRERHTFLRDDQRLAGELSLGQRQILELVMSLLSEPRLLLLDEPAAGLSPEETSAIVEVIRWASERLSGVIVIVEHDMSLVRQLADNVFVMHNGSLLAEGSVAEVQANEKVRAVYVGAEK